jgi:hypothetical protein
MVRKLSVILFTFSPQITISLAEVILPPFRVHNVTVTLEREVRKKRLNRNQTILINPFKTVDKSSISLTEEGRDY